MKKKNAKVNLLENKVDLHMLTFLVFNSVKPVL